MKRRISLGDDSLRRPKDLGGDPGHGLGDKEEVTQVEIPPVWRHASIGSAVGERLEQLPMTLEGGAESLLELGVLAPTIDVRRNRLADFLANRDTVDPSDLPEHLFLVRVEPQSPCHGPMLSVIGRSVKVSIYLAT